MIAVIFRAQIGQLDEEYTRMARELRELALRDYGCVEFTSCQEGDAEIAISYWNHLEDVARWRENAFHQGAQAKGKSGWYTSYQVQIVELLREYQGP